MQVRVSGSSTEEKQNIFMSEIMKDMDNITDKMKSGAEESWIEFLEKSIEQHNKILLCKEDELIYAFLQSETAKSVSEKIIIISTKKIITNINNIIFHQMEEEKIGRIADFYFTYEFSDDFFYVSRENMNYARLFHFVDTGILSINEMFEALIH